MRRWELSSIRGRAFSSSVDRKGSGDLNRRPLSSPGFPLLEQAYPSRRGWILVPTRPRLAPRQRSRETLTVSNRLFPAETELWFVACHRHYHARRRVVGGALPPIPAGVGLCFVVSSSSPVLTRGVGGYVPHDESFLLFGGTARPGVEMNRICGVF